jgi:hypothetical protein
MGTLHDLRVPRKRLEEAPFFGLIGAAFPMALKKEISARGTTMDSHKLVVTCINMIPR